MDNGNWIVIIVGLGLLALAIRRAWLARRNTRVVIQRRDQNINIPWIVTYTKAPSSRYLKESEDRHIGGPGFDRRILYGLTIEEQAGLIKDLEGQGIYVPSVISIERKAMTASWLNSGSANMDLSELDPNEAQVMKLMVSFPLKHVPVRYAFRVVQVLRIAVVFWNLSHKSPDQKGDSEK